MPVRALTVTTTGEEVDGAKELLDGESVADNVIVVLTAGFHAQVAISDPFVGLAKQPGMVLPSNMKLTVPATLAVAVIFLVTKNSG